MLKLRARGTAMAVLLTLAIALTAVPGRNTLAADTGGQLSTAVYPSDGARFPGYTQWSTRDGGWIDAAKWVAGDFNGEGKTDIAAIWNNGGTNTITVSQSSGSGFTRSHWATNAGGWLDSTVWLAGDFNGDGKTDIAAAWNDGGQLSTAVYLSDGTKFRAATQWSTRDGGWIDAAKWVAGDFNGDGKTDIAAIWNNGGTNTITVSQSTGSGFTRSHWATNAGGWLDSSAWLAGDFNGDGKTDIAAAWNDGGQLSTAVYLSDGARFRGATQWSTRDGGWIDAAKWVAGDFNGDGKTDIAAIWNNGGTNTITVSQSSGSGFTRSHWATSAGGWLDSSAWLAGDFNGDGKTDIAAAWNDSVPVPEALRPGTHMVVLMPGQWRPERTGKHWSPPCHAPASPIIPPEGVFSVGWAQVEIDDDPCTATVAHLAVRFDEGPLDQVPVKGIDRAVLTYDEDPAHPCTWMGDPGSLEGFQSIGITCWRGGSGLPVSKPNGCVEILGFPTFDWINVEYNLDHSGLIPYTTDSNVKRSTPREWDVSEPYRQQYTRSAPLGGFPPPPFGFLLAGGLSLEQLTGEDSTHCISFISNLQLHVTYTVPPGSGQPPVIR